MEADPDVSSKELFILARDDFLEPLLRRVIRLKNPLIRKLWEENPNHIFGGEKVLAALTEIYREQGKLFYFGNDSVVIEKRIIRVKTVLLADLASLKKMPPPSQSQANTDSFQEIAFHNVRVSGLGEYLLDVKKHGSAPVWSDEKTIYYNLDELTALAEDIWQSARQNEKVAFEQLKNDILAARLEEGGSFSADPLIANLEQEDWGKSLRQNKSDFVRTYLQSIRVQFGPHEIQHILDKRKGIAGKIVPGNPLLSEAAGEVRSALAELRFSPYPYAGLATVLSWLKTPGTEYGLAGTLLISQINQYLINNQRKFPAIHFDVLEGKNGLTQEMLLAAQYDQLTVLQIRKLAAFLGETLFSKEGILKPLEKSL